MRKLLWCCAVVALLAGAYWSVAHGTVHPESPVGRCLAWLGAARPAPVVHTCHVQDTCCSEREPLVVQGHKPAGRIVVAPDFPLMGGPDGEPPVVAATSIATEPVREVVGPDVLSEEVRIMPGVEDEAPPAAPAGITVSLGLKVDAEAPFCPVQLIGSISCRDGCRLPTLVGLYEYLCAKLSGGLPAVGCAKAEAGCCKECGNRCPAGCKKAELIGEPPVEVEECEPARQPRSWLHWWPGLPQAVVDTMEARSSDLGRPRTKHPD